MRCPFCGADFKPNPGDVLLTCPYCGTAFTVKGEKFKDHYMIRVHYSLREAQETLLYWVSKQLGVPDDISWAANFIEYKLKFYPFWIAHVDATTQYKGKDKYATFSGPWPQRPGAYKYIHWHWKDEEGTVDRRHEIPILGQTKINKAIAEMPIPVRAKEYFNIEMVKKHHGEIIDSQIDKDKAEEIAKQRAYDRQTQHILEEIDKIEWRDDKIDLKEIFLIHVPVWELTYRYGSKKYKAYVSASNGYIIEAQYPKSMMFRAGGTLTGLIFLGIAALMFMYVIKLFPAGAFVTGLETGGVGLAILYKALSRGKAKEKI